MLPSNIAHKLKVISGPSFFKVTDVGTIVDDVDVMAELEDFFGETIQKRKRTKACERRKVSHRK